MTVTGREAFFRAHERRSVRLSGVLRHERAGSAREVRVFDLSLAGAGLGAIEAIEPGSAVVLELLAPTLWDPLTLHALVVWCRRGVHEPTARLGVRFEHETHEALGALFDVLSVHAYE